MARLAGYGGSVLVANASATGIREWSLDYIVEVYDARGFDDGQQPHPIMGKIDWSGSFRGAKDGAPLSIGTQVALQLRESNTTGQVSTGSGFITGLHPTVAIDGLVEYAYDFVGLGTLTLPTA